MPISIIQAVGADSGSGTVTKNVTIAATQAHSVLVAVSTLNQTQYTVTDSGSSVWNNTTSLATTGPSSNMVYNTAAGITTVTFNNPGSNSCNQMIVEVGGAVNGSTVVDQGLGIQISGTSWTTGNMSATTNANDLILCFIFHSASDPTWGPGTSFFGLTGVGLTAGVHNNVAAGHSMFGEFRLVNATSTYAGTGTAGTSGTFNSIVFAMKQDPGLGSQVLLGQVLT